MTDLSEKDRLLAAANPPAGFEPITSSNAFGGMVGPIFEKVTEDEIGFRRGFRVLDKHINSGGAVHGGMLMTFADILGGISAFRNHQGPVVTVRLTTDFVAGGMPGEWIEGYGQVCQYDPDNGITHVKGRIYCGDRTIMTFHGLFKGRRKSKKA